MSNHSSELSLSVFVIDRNEPKEVLVEIVNLDSDYQEVSEKIVDAILKRTKSLEKRIEKVLNIMSYRGVESTFLLNNDTYCGGYQHEITDIGNNKVVLSLAYTS